MDKFLKRKDAPESEDPPTKVKRVEGMCLVVLPGAGGSLALNMNTMVLDPLEGMGFSVRRGSLKWNTFTAKHKDNVAAVLALCPTDKDFYLMGNSFGNRVIAEMMKAKQLPARCRGAVLCGFPLYGDKDKKDRLEQLQGVPKDSTLMLISGTNDEFLNRDFLPVKGAALLSSVLDDMKITGRHEVHFIEGGKHDVPSAAGGKKVVEEAATRVVNLVRNFCS